MGLIQAEWAALVSAARDAILCALRAHGICCRSRVGRDNHSNEGGMKNWQWVLLSFALSFSATAPLPAQAQKVVPAPGDTTSERAAAAGAELPITVAEPHKQPETVLDFAVAGGWMMVPLTVLSLVWLS